jgi:hypothetical protein
VRKDDKKLQVVPALKLIVQSDDTVMIPAGGVPVLIGPNEGIDEGASYLRQHELWVPVLVTATNFIRCGCPEVLIWSAYAQKIEHEKHHGWNAQMSKFEELKKHLQRSLSVFGPPYCSVEVQHGGGVIIIERSTKQ